MQELFDSAIQEQLQPPILGVRILARKLRDIGLILTDQQRSDLERQFVNIEDGVLKFHFTDEQLQSAGVLSEEELRPKIQQIVDTLGQAVEEFADGLDDMMEGMVLHVVGDMAVSVRETLREKMNDMIEDREGIYYGFAEGISAIWGKALNLLQGLIVIADRAMLGHSGNALEPSIA